MMGDWVEEANCSNSGIDFFGNVTLEMRLRCEKCPVQLECREYAVHNEGYGFWGNRTAEQLEKERKKRGIVLPSLGPINNVVLNRRDEFVHGTVSGYSMHRRRKIPICDDCRRANTEALRKWRMEKKNEVA